MSRGTADNRATADREAERDRTAEDALGIYSGGLQKEKIDTSKNIDLADPKPLRLAHTNFEQGEDLFKDLRKDLRKHGYNGLAEEIKDLRAERSKALEGITDRLYRGVMCLSDLLSKVPVEEIDDAPENKILKRAFDEIPRLIDQYNALIDDEAKFVDTALANLRGWQSATGDDVRELKPEIVRGANAAESAGANAAAAKTAAEGAKESAEGAEQVAKESKSLVEIVVAGIDKAVNLIRACLAPRSVDCEVTIKEFCDMLWERAGVDRDVRTVQLWEQYLKSGGEKGQKPPQGYTLTTRQNKLIAAAWIKTYGHTLKPKPKARKASYREDWDEHSISTSEGGESRLDE